MSFLQRLLHLPSKATISKSRFGTPPPHCFPFTSSSSSSSSSSKQQISHPQTPPSPLTEEHLSKLHHLIPRLCHHHRNHLSTAVRLTFAALLANSPLHSLPLSPLIQSLTSHPDTSPTMSLLTRLRHAPRSSHHIAPIALMLLKSYFQSRRCKHALAVFRWLRRPDSPCSPDREVYEVVIEGFCRNGLVFEGLVAMRDMVVGKLVPCCGPRERVYRGLLREARVEEAVELNDALLGFERGGGGEEGRERVLMVLERVIAGWNE